MSIFKNIRAELGITREKFAEFLGKSVMSISNYENKKTTISLKDAKKLVNIGINIQYLLGNSNTMFADGCTKLSAIDKIGKKIPLKKIYV